MEASSPGGDGRRASARLPGILLAVLLVAGCTALPRPFEHETASELVSDQRALAPLAIRPVAGVPGLAEALAHALDEQEIAATTAEGESFSEVTGAIAADTGPPTLVWRLASANGATLGEVRQPLSGDTPPSDGERGRLAQDAAVKIAALLRGEDSGTLDLAASPHVFLQGLAVPKGIDGDSLARAMGRALSQQGLILDQQSPDFMISGRLQIVPGPNGKDMVSVEWTVKKPDGTALGAVSQASQVNHGRLLGPLTALAREIAEAGAGGVMDVIRQKGAAAP